MRRSSLSALIALATSAVFVGVATLAQAGNTAGPSETSTAQRDTEPREMLAPNGQMTWVQAPRQPDRGRVRPSLPAKPGTIQYAGPSRNRYDLVMLGDGYTKNEQELFEKQARALWAEVLKLQPFKDYRGFFNVWMVKVESPESGVDNDPLLGQNVKRNTAMDMHFNCGGTQRLLCVDDAKAAGYAALAKASDSVVVLGNTRTYGGAGGPYSTVSGGNDQAKNVLPHELGHTLGKLADEYEYTSNPYNGPETDRVNLSVRDAAKMAADKVKWHRWLGSRSPDGGTVGAFAGGALGRTGVYRPTEGSIMRVLGGKFSVVGREAMVAGFYAKTRPIDEVKPSTTEIRRNAVLKVTTPRPAHGLAVRWYLDGKEIPGSAAKRTLHLGPLKLTGAHEITVRVFDRTDWIRDPANRELMTQTHQWKVKG